MKKLLILILIIAVVVTVFYLKEKLSLPVTFKICSLGYQDCYVVARFKDRDSCETTKQYWGWICDKTDKKKITCVENESDIASSYCD